MEPSTLQSIAGQLIPAEVQAVVAVVLVAAAVAVIVHWSRRRRPARNPGRRDPNRTFSAEVRSAAFAAAARRCEFDGPIWWRRCRLPAEHADHFFPWTSGGASSPANCVAACAPHNLSKGAKMPSAGLQRRIARRRRADAPTAPNRTVGQWYGRIAGQR